ncbi:innexin unc-9-like isoform X2 [Convolutriloba macropyga]|uniref:innexin unc-9-like isoform X2 n=1 Tax=Convolutriloba macropyga TaxID=536237 RepID=UPI003F5211B4
MLSTMLRALVKLRLKEGCDGDWVDRLNNKYTAILLLTFSSLVGIKQYGGSPINCWCPGHFDSQWVDYANSICWVQNTYFLPFHVSLKDGKLTQRDTSISYYQWIPVILFLMSASFYLPYVLWKEACSAVGLDVDSLVSSLTAFDSTINPEIWNKTLTQAARQVERYIESQREIRSGYIINARKAFILCNKRHSGYLTTFYLCLKAVYVINIFFHILFLNWLLGYNFNYYGWQVVNSRVSSSGYSDAYRTYPEGPDFETSFGFPHVSLCDFRVRVLGNLHQYTVQCVLNINLFNEKIFVVLWFWFVLVAILTCLNFIIWLLRILWCHDRVTYIRKHLKFLDRVHCGGGANATSGGSESERRSVRKFVNAYLRSDGVFLIRLISRNTSSVITSELVAQLYDDFIAHPTFNFNRPPPIPTQPKPSTLDTEPNKDRLLLTPPPLNIPPPTFESAITASAPHPHRSGIELAGDFNVHLGSLGEHPYMARSKDVDSSMYPNSSPQSDRRRPSEQFM